MKKIIEKNLAEIIVISIFVLAFSSCTTTKQIQEKPGEKKSQNPVNFFAPVLLIVLIGFVSVN